MTYRHRLAAFLVFAILSGCSDSQEGNQVSLGVVHHPTAVEGGQVALGVEGQPRQFTNNVGQRITIEKGYLVFSSAELNECDTISSAILRNFSLVPSAHAHSESSSTRSGEPVVENLLRGDLALLSLASLEPPSGDYCNLEIELSPADDDALHLPTDIDMVGRTFYFSGTFDAGSGDTSFLLSSTESAEKNLRFMDSNKQETTLSLRGSETSPQSIVVGMNYDSWFENVNLDSMSDAEASQKLMQNILNSLHMHTGEVHSGHSHGDSDNARHDG